jgi:hypothetical protein
MRIFQLVLQLIELRLGDVELRQGGFLFCIVRRRVPRLKFN